MTASERPLMVSIVSTNDGRWLGACLESLEDVQEELDVNVVANVCTDETEEICSRSPLGITVIRTDARLGFAACNNICMLKALRDGYEYGFLLNPDTRVHPHAIRDLLHFMDSHTDVGIAGSLQIKYGDGTWSEPNEWSRLTLEHAKSLGQGEQKQGEFTWVEHNYVQGAAMMLRLSLIPRIGLLDPIYRTFYEETDLCRRSLLSGRRVALLLNSKVQHYGGGNWKSNIKKHLERDSLFLRNQFLYFLSGASAWPSMIRVAISLCITQIKMILLHREDVILPLWRYPFVLWSAAIRFRAIYLLHQRNQIIQKGQTVPEPLWQVGSDRGQ